MSSVWIILILFLGGMSMFYGRAKHAMVADTSAQENGDINEYGDNENDNSVSHYDNEWDEVVASRPEVFSYETPKGMSTPMSKAEETMPLQEQPVASHFDLRQAVIYQTVLSNNYINFGNYNNQ